MTGDPRAPALPFLAEFTPRAFGWRGHRRAVAALRDAVEALREARRRDLAGAREAALTLLALLWPALQQVNRASGDVTPAVHRALDAIFDLLRAPSPDEPILARIIEAIRGDYGDLLAPFASRFGALCPDAATASRWADRLRPAVRRAWSSQPPQRSPEALACLSALLRARRYGEAHALVSVGAPADWRVRVFGAEALRAQGQPDAAIAFALASEVDDDQETAARARFCEEVLLAAGQRDAAYTRFAHAARDEPTHRGRFEALVARYPERAPRAILDALIAEHSEEPGKWFAAAHALGEFDLALSLLAASPADPKATLRAAQSHLDDRPCFACRVAWLTLRWAARGRHYKFTPAQVRDAWTVAMRSASPDERSELDAEARQWVARAADRDFAEALRPLMEA